MRYVRFLGKNGTAKERAQAIGCGLNSQTIYQVTSEWVEDWQTDIRLEGVPFRHNSVMFEVVEVKPYPHGSEEARHYGN